MNHRLPLLPAFLVLCCGFSAGCSKNSLDIAPVSGTVSFKGKPLTHGNVVFIPAAGTQGPSSRGEIQADGSFKMETLGQPGAPVGNHIVTVHCREKQTAEQERALRVPPSLIPLRYGSAEQTPFRFEVKKGSNDCPLVLE